MGTGGEEEPPSRLLGERERSQRPDRYGPETWLQITSALFPVLMTPIPWLGKGAAKASRAQGQLCLSFPFLGRKHPSELVLHSP